MKKPIVVKGLINVDKSEMDKIRAGSCAQYGVVCDKDMASRRQLEMAGAVSVDRLWIV